MSSTEKIVVVTGDATLDWNLASTPRADDTVVSTDDRTEASCQPGGAALVGELLENVAAGVRRDGRAIEVRRVDVPARSRRPGAAGFHHSYARWTPLEGGNGDPSRWRVEDFFGLDRQLPGKNPALRRLANEETADLVVLDDAGLGFRDDEELWPEALWAEGRPKPWVLLKMAKPVAEGPLWDRLIEGKRADRLVVLIASNDLRLMEAQISRGLSWERTAEDLLSELVNNPRLRALAGCAHVVVSFQTTGALLLSHREGRLFFDPQLLEDAWSEKHPGQVIGYTSCLAASLARQLLLEPADPDLARAIQSGVAAMRVLHESGYVRTNAPPPRLRFPMKVVAEKIESADCPLAEASVRDPARFLLVPGRSSSPRQPPLWRILEDLHPKQLEELARQIALGGVEAALPDVPIAKFEKLTTVDRQEIEAFRSIRTLILEYSEQQRPKRPLSIAVFGPPGSGKSFGVEQVALSILPGRIKKLTFNLSQLQDPSGLHGALHQVRDHALAGELPLVFWDEFDSPLGDAELGWLRHFLVPMQDGTFQEGELTHAVGPAIFVFAGGTRHRMSEFAGETGEEFRNVKGPDFVSRLKGYVDILGPNPIDGDAAADPYYLVRRAILLRSMLIRDCLEQFFHPPKPDGRLEIDSGVLRGLLQTRTYRHGARSLESIVQMSRLHGARRFSRSALPAKPQLDLHVDGREFLALVQAPELDDELAERLAEAMHVVYCQGMLAAGYDWQGSDEYLGRERLAAFAGRSPTGKTQPTLVDWGSLGEGERQQNLNLARSIPLKLVRTGYVMVAKLDDSSAAFTDEDVELLAEEEHERWLWEKLRSGARYAPQRGAGGLEHPAMLPWRRLSAAEKVDRYKGYADRVGDGALSEEEKEKDRGLMQGIPEALLDEGYTIVKVAGEPERHAPRINVTQGVIVQSFRGTSDRSRRPTT